MSDDIAGVLMAYGISDCAVSRIASGLVNRSWKVISNAHQRFVLQQLNPIFDPAVNETLLRATAKLAEAGLLTPQLVATEDNQPFVMHGDECWRLLTYIDGTTRERFTAAGQAQSAGRVLGAFHRALADFEAGAVRLSVHDTRQHIGRLRETLDSQRGHRDYDAIAPVGAAILERSADLALAGDPPPRTAHGDPKASNVMFDGDGKTAICMIDLDTIGPMSLPLELGDALRSWCNPAGEDEASGSFDLNLLTAALVGYRASGPVDITAAEQEAIVPATERIQLELAARFCTDALLEAYFAWDEQRFASRSAHNLVRAQGQLGAANALAAQRGQAEDAVRTALPAAA
ncbi:MAG: phosphotransferase [Gammaproteobacteria bacterium]|nr:phosphotransferase [Gammaproteobacteria bacterium]NNM01243.1 phosphotransferase [Gammaproteobacteria bacterium]